MSTLKMMGYVMAKLKKQIEYDKDIRDKFHLGDYYDIASITVHIYGYYDGELTFKVPITGDERCMYTKTFCKYMGFSGEMTLYWLLKYGHKLPRHIHQL